MIVSSTLAPNLVTLLQARAEHRSPRLSYLFLQDGETQTAQLNYADLDRQARAIAAYLQLIVPAGSRALLLYAPGLEFISALFGCWYAGMIAVPICPPKGEQRLSRWQSVIADAQASCVITTGDLMTKLEPQSTLPQLSALTWICSDQIAIDQSTEWQPPRINADTIAVLQYTSGSTSAPKGVMVTHRNILHNSEQIQAAFQLTSQSVSVSWLPHFHDMGLIDGIIQPLYTGFQAVLLPPSAFIQKPICWLKAISRYRATHSGSPNQGYEHCIRRITAEQCEQLDLSQWQSAYSGAEPIQHETLERFAQKFHAYGFEPKFFYPCYGMAEATLMISGGSLEAEPAYCTVDAIALQQNRIVTATTGRVQHFVSVGRAWLGTQIAIVNPNTHRRCAPEEVGEIWVSGNSVTQGYWNRKAETETAFQGYLDTGEGAFLRTGDLGFVQAGELYITGRLKDLIILWGRNHYPQDIELTVQQSHPALRVACGAAIDVNVDGQERLVIVQEVDRSFLKQLPNEEIVQAIRQAVSEQHDIQVSTIVLLKPASLPRTSSGKIQRSQCRADFLENRLVVINQWTETKATSELPKIKAPPTIAAIEDWLILRLSQTANIAIEDIDPSLPFASYGLDSSLLLSLTGELSDWLNLRLMPTVFWESPNIDSLALYLSTQIEQSPNPNWEPPL